MTRDGAVVHSLAVKDGKVFIGGNFTAVGGEPRQNLAAVDAADAADGSVDLDFAHAMFKQALGPSNLLANPSTLDVVLENTETNMSGVQMLQLGGRVRALKEAGTSVEVGTLP